MVNGFNPAFSSAEFITIMDILRGNSRKKARKVK